MREQLDARGAAGPILAIHSLRPLTKSKLDEGHDLYNGSMHSSALVQRMLSWLVAASVLLGTFAPALSFAVSMSQGAGQVEICTAQGMVLVQVDADGQQLPPVWSAHHCKLCGIQGQDLAPPPVAAARVALPAARHVQASPAVEAPPAGQPRGHALARAPPPLV